VTDDQDQIDERAERAVRTALDHRAETYVPAAVDPTRITRASRGRALLRFGAAAAAVVVVAGGVLFGVRWSTNDGPGPGHDGSALGPTSSAAANGVGDRQTRQDAAREAEQVLASMPMPDGARRAQVTEVSPLARLTTFLGGLDKSVTRSAFWLVPTDPQDLADWYTLNPPAGMDTDGGPHSVGGSRNSDGSWSEEMIYDGLPDGQASHSSALVQVTPVAGQAGVRITVFSSWQPARKPQSFAPDDVPAVTLVVTRNGHRTISTIDDAGDVSRLVRVYNSLPGTHALAHSCPASMGATTYRLTFDSATREVSAYFAGSCDSAWWVRVNGKPVAPALANNSAAGEGDGLTSLIDDLTE
jgi:hypothetical protein